MEKLTEIMDRGVIRTKCFVYDFLHKENGDTNFISIAIIAAIVVVLAGFFIYFGKDIMKTMSESVKKFIQNPAERDPNS